MGSPIAKTQGWVVGNASFKVSAPRFPFDPNDVPVAPDYADEACWAALPTKISAANFVPASNAYADVSILQSSNHRTHSAPMAYPEICYNSEPAADCFFVHPACYFGKQWNCPIGDLGVAEPLDMILALQASAFNESCRVYAPHYRQASIASSIASAFDWESASKALELAFNDVRMAFRHYLEHFNEGRPFILASHSQGGYHLLRILEEEVDRYPERLASFVCCYLIGSYMPIDKLDRLRNIERCRGPRDLQCIIGWDTRSSPRVPGTVDFASFVGNWFQPGSSHAGPTLGTSPYSWKDAADLNEEEEPSSLHEGFVYATWHDPKSNVVPRLHLAAFISQEPSGAKIASIHCLRAADALKLAIEESEGGFQIRFDPSGSLLIPQFKRPGIHGRFNPSADGSYHNDDYTFFYFNIRSNVKTRLEAFKEKPPILHTEPTHYLVKGTDQGADQQAYPTPGIPPRTYFQNGTSADSSCVLAGTVVPAYAHNGLWVRISPDDSSPQWMSRRDLSTMVRVLEPIWDIAGQQGSSVTTAGEDAVTETQVVKPRRNKNPFRYTPPPPDEEGRVKAEAQEEAEKLKAAAEEEVARLQAAAEEEVARLKTAAEAEATKVIAEADEAAKVAEMDDTTKAAEKATPAGGSWFNLWGGKAAKEEAKEAAQEAEGAAQEAEAAPMSEVKADLVEPAAQEGAAEGVKAAPAAETQAQSSWFGFGLLGGNKPAKEGVEEAAQEVEADSVSKGQTNLVEKEAAADKEVGKANEETATVKEAAEEAGRMRAAAEEETARMMAEAQEEADKVRAAAREEAARMTAAAEQAAATMMAAAEAEAARLRAAAVEEMKAKEAEAAKKAEKEAEWLKAAAAEEAARVKAEEEAIMLKAAEKEAARVQAQTKAAEEETTKAVKIQAEEDEAAEVRAAAELEAARVRVSAEEEAAKVRETLEAEVLRVRAAAEEDAARVRAAAEEEAARVKAEVEAAKAKAATEMAARLKTAKQDAAKVTAAAEEAAKVKAAQVEAAKVKVAADEAAKQAAKEAEEKRSVSPRTHKSRQEMRQAEQAKRLAREAETAKKKADRNLARLKANVRVSSDEAAASSRSSSPLPTPRDNTDNTTPQTTPRNASSE